MGIPQAPGVGELFSGGSQAPALMQLAQLLQQMPQQRQAQAPGLNLSQGGIPQIPQAPGQQPQQQQAQPPTSISQGLGGLMQGIGFGTSPQGTYGPFNGGSALQSLGNSISSLPSSIANWFSGGNNGG